LDGTGNYHAFAHTIAISFIFGTMSSSTYQLLQPPLPLGLFVFGITPFKKAYSGLPKNTAAKMIQ
jgi:hypothetical protein